MPVPGQSLILQGTVSLEEPEQVCPPFAGAGPASTRARVFVSEKSLTGPWMCMRVVMLDKTNRSGDQIKMAPIIT